MKQKLIQLGPGMYTQTAAPCDDCHGQGTIFEEKDRCTNCKGQRIVESTKTFQVTIEPGVPH
jgi:DnaJ family protein A protein 2